MCRAAGIFLAMRSTSGSGRFMHAADVADGRPRRHRPEGDDLGHVVRPVLLADVPDEVLAAVLADVDVEIGHLVAAGVHEPLEEEAVPERVDRREAQQVRHHAPDAAAAGRARNAPLLGVPDEVPHDQEVTGEPLALDDLQFVLEAVAVDLRRPVP